MDNTYTVYSLRFAPKKKHIWRYVWQDPCGPMKLYEHTPCELCQCFSGIVLLTGHASALATLVIGSPYFTPCNVSEQLAWQLAVARARQYRSKIGNSSVGCPIEFAKVTRLPSKSLPAHAVAAKQPDYNSLAANNHGGVGGPQVWIFVKNCLRRGWNVSGCQQWQGVVSSPLAPSAIETNATKLQHLDWKHSRCSCSLARPTSALRYGLTLVWALLAPGSSEWRQWQVKTHVQGGLAMSLLLW